MELHRDHGYTTALDGTDDKDLDSSIMHFLDRLGMWRVRRQIALEMRKLHHEGFLTR